MIQTSYKFKLDLKNKTSIPFMEYYQTDTGTAQMDISIVNDSKIVNLEGHTIVCNIVKADNTEVQNVANIVDSINGLIQITLTTQALAAIGENTVQLTIYEGTNRKSTHQFKYKVKDSLLNEVAPVSTNEYTTLTQLIADVQTVENILNTSEADRVTAENIRTTNENNRILLKGQLDTLKLDLETLQTSLNALESNVETEEGQRVLAEEQREVLKGQLETLKTSLENLQTNLNNSETTRSNNETIRQQQEADRQALKTQLEGLQSTLEGLENTLNTNEGIRGTTFNNKVSEVDNKIIEVNNTIADVENRFSLLTSSQQQASEVINARTSTIRNKTFVDLNSRIAENEKDIFTSQATNVVDSVASVNHLTNSLNGASDVGVKGQSLVQLVKNGNFVNANNWSAIGGALTVTNNIATVTGNGTNISTTVRQITDTPLTNGKKVFIKAKVKFKTSSPSFVVLQAFNGSSTFIGNTSQVSNPVVNTEYTLYGVITVGTQTGNLMVQFNGAYVDIATANGKVMEVQDVMALDLTSLGLDTKTADEINAMLPSYFEGIASVEGGSTVIKSVGENLFDLNTVIKRTVNSIVSISGDSITITDDYYCRGTINVKPNTDYYIQATRSGTGSGNISIYTPQATGATVIKTLGTSNGTFNSGNNTKVSIYLYGGNGTVNTTTYTNVMINTGTTVKPYTPYKESNIQITDYIDEQYFPLRGLPSVSDEVTSGKVYKRVSDKHIFNGSESGWIDADNGLINTMRFAIPLVNSLDSTLGMTTFGKFISSGTSADDTENLQISNSTLYIRILRSKLTTQNLSTFKTWLGGNNITILYALKTPIEIQLNRKIDIPIYKNGTMIVEPSKLYPKLSYSYPTNLGKSVESIVNNLSWIKDNQQFIMSYLLNLDTRLTLGGH